MKTFSIFTFLLIITIALTSETNNQNGWSFYLNEKRLISASSNQPILALKKSSLTEQDTFMVSYFFCGSGTEAGDISEVEIQNSEGKSIGTFREESKEYSIFNEVHFSANDLLILADKNNISEIKVYFRAITPKYTTATIYLLSIRLK